MLHERALLAAKDECAQGRLVNIAQTVARLDIVVAAIQVAVVFQCRPVTAFGRKHAQAVAAETCFQCHVEIAHEHAPDVVAHPLFEYFDKKASVLRGPDRALRDEVARLGVQRPFAAACWCTPALVGQVDGLRRGPFDDGNELQPFGLQFVAQESVDRATVVLVRRVDRAQDVARDIVAAQQLPAPHHPVKRTSTKTIDPVTVMQCARAVDAQANKKSVLLQKLAPVFVDQRAIGLDAVLDSLARSAVLLDQLNRVREERQLHQRWLAALPGHLNLRRCVRFQQLADVGLQRLVRHVLASVRIQRLLGQEKAVAAVDIAARSAGFCQHVKARHRIATGV